MPDFHRLAVWRKAHELVLEVYRATAGFPTHERFGICSQLRRAAVSVASNIAEGSGRSGDADFARFIDFARGSTAELECQMLLARDLHYLPDDCYVVLVRRVDELRRMLTSLLHALRAAG